MLAVEGDSIETKLKILNEQVGLSHTAPLRNPDITEDHRCRECCQPDRQPRVDLFVTENISKLSSLEIDNKLSNKNISAPYSRNKDDYVSKRMLKNSKRVKIEMEFEDEILKINPQARKDIVNRFIKKLNTLEPICFNHNKQDVWDTLNKISNDDIKLSYTSNDDINKKSYTSNDDINNKSYTSNDEIKVSDSSSDDSNKFSYPECCTSEHDITSVKEAFPIVERAGNQPEKLRNIGIIIETESLKTDIEIATKYIADTLEMEKENANDQEDSKIEYMNVLEKHQIEEESDLNELKKFYYSDSLSFDSIEKDLLTSLEGASFFPFYTSNTEVTAPVYSVKYIPSLSLTLGSSHIFANRLSLELRYPRNPCYHGNIFVSQQTNTSPFSYAAMMHDIEKSLNENMLYKERKANNLGVFSDPLMSDDNLFRLSLSKKCLSKDIHMTLFWYNGEFSDQDCKLAHHDMQGQESESSLANQELSSHLIALNSSFIQEKDFESSSFTDLQISYDSHCKFQEADVDSNFEEKDSGFGLYNGSLQEWDFQNSLTDLIDPYVYLCLKNSLQSDLFDELNHLASGNCGKSHHREIDATPAELEPPEYDCSFDNLQEKKCAEGWKLKKNLEKKQVKAKKSRNLIWTHKCLQSPSFVESKRLRHMKKIRNRYWRKEKKNKLTKSNLNQDTEQSKQEDCQKMTLKDEGFWKMFPPISDKNNRKKKKCQARRVFKRNTTVDVKPKYYKSKTQELKKKERKKRKKNQSKMKSRRKSTRENPNVKADQVGKWIKRIGKSSFSMIKQSGQWIRDLEVHFLPPRGHPSTWLKEVKFQCRSGRESHRGSSESVGRSNGGSAGGKQDGGDKGSGRAGSSGGQNGGGNGTGGDDNKKNNNNFNGNSSNKNEVGENKSNGKNANKKRAVESLDNKNAQNPPFEQKAVLLEAAAVLPSLPPPILDAHHLALRQSAEESRKLTQAVSDIGLFGVPPDEVASFLSKHEELQSLGAASFPAKETFLAAMNEAPKINHTAMSIDQLCDIIGDATQDLPLNIDAFKKLNVCLTHLIHNLTLAANDDRRATSFDNCCVCLVLSQLLIHMANPGHEGFSNSCNPCTQMFNLMFQHCIGCIESGRQKFRFTESDLCYKICMYLNWKGDKDACQIHRLKIKVQKYCDKVLGSTIDAVSLSCLPQAISDMVPDILSTGPSSSTSRQSTSLSLSGNIVTTETGNQVQSQQQQDVQLSPESVTRASSLTGNVAVTSSGGFAPCSGRVPVGITGNESASHMKLSRKPSHKTTRAVPSPIEEENQLEPNSLDLGTDQGNKDGTENKNAIIQRWVSKLDDTNEAQKTYGERQRYDSLPVGHIHDVEQFYSESTRPLGAPGVGEVVYGHPEWLTRIASFWDKKREECERTRTCPYQHREEGVILASQKKNFGILHTRYQKHHQWEKVTHLGNGMSGNCHLAVDLQTNFKFCCKKIHLLRYTEEELSLWTEMDHPNIVQLYGALRHGEKIYIFLEFIDGGSLAACIEEQKRLGRRISHWSAIQYFQQILKVLVFLMKNNVLHEDIKADNILLRRDSPFLAVTDFGTSRRLQDPVELKNKSPVGSPTHWSPEKASMEGHGFPSDVWAAVCVLVHMLSGDPPWVKRYMKKVAVLNFIIYKYSPPMEDVPDNVQLVVRNLIEKGFVKDAQRRPSASELLRHPAFRILDEGRPETYFSTLTSIAHSGLHAIRQAASLAEHQKFESTNVLESSPETAVLFETKISAGPYQESDNRPDYRNRQLDNIRHADDTAARRGQKGNSNESSLNEQDDNVTSTGKDVGTNSVGQNRERDMNSDEDIEGPLSADDIALQASRRVHELTEPIDINKLLPQFDELFDSGSSFSAQSIKFLLDDVQNAENLGGTKQPPLQVYVPPERNKDLPNLSIFGTPLETPSQMNKEFKENHSATLSPGTQKRNPVSSSPHDEKFIDRANPQLRNKLMGEQISPNPMQFQLSSESEECTSADLFDSGSVIKNLSTIQQAEAERSSSPGESLHDHCFPNDVSPIANATSTASSSGATNLQQRKPTNLKLDVSCLPLPSSLTHSQSCSQALSNIGGNETELKKRANTWSQMTIPPNNFLHTNSTPNSSHGTLAKRNWKASGTSIPSTASSGHSQFSYRPNSVKEEQERMLQELTDDMLNTYSQSSSGSDGLISFIQDQCPDEQMHCDPSEQQETTADFQTLLLGCMDDTKQVGHNLKFYNEENKYMFTMLIEDWPTYWKYVITRVRQKITQINYTHFTLHDMDNQPVDINRTLAAREFKVIRRQNQGFQCWCQKCEAMF